MVSVERSRSRSRKSGYPGKSKVDNESSTVNNYSVGVSSRHNDYRANEEEKQARIKKEQVEKKILEEKELEESTADFDTNKKSRWDRHNKKVNVSKRKAADIIKEGGNYIAEDIILNEVKNAAQPFRNAAGYAKNVVLDVVQNPKHHKAVKDIVKGAGKAIQNTTENLNKDILAYGQAKAIMNDTGEYTEKIVRDKYGNVVGVERNFKHHGKDTNKKDNTFGLKPPVQHNENKPGPTNRKGTLIARKGTLVKNQKSMWDKTEKAGPTNHRHSGVSLTKKDKFGIGRHIKSNVQLVKSSLPTLEEYNDAEPTIFNESDFQGFAKKPFEGFAQKAPFHPINKHRRCAGFDSTVTPQGNMLGREI